MSNANRKRDILVRFWVTPAELDMIKNRMKQIPTDNRGAYLRKMAIDGVVLKLEIPELKELVSLMRYMGNNTNQIARRMNETGRIYEADVQEVLQQQERLWEGMRELLAGLARLK